MLSTDPLTRNYFAQRTHESLAAFRLDSTLYSGHFYRAGCATTAALVGLADYKIKLLGRWTSSVYHQYIWAPSELLAAISARLVACPNKLHPSAYSNPFIYI